MGSDFEEQEDVPYDDHLELLEDPYRMVDRTPFKPPKLMRCTLCNTEFFGRRMFEPCPRCGGKAEEETEK